MRGEFSYADEHFADLQLLRYRLKDFKSLSKSEMFGILPRESYFVWARHNI